MAWCNFIAAAEIEILGDVSSSPSSELSPLGAAGALFVHVDDCDFYRPLNQSRQEIRVIKIHPGNRDDDMIFEIEFMSLCDSQRTSYEALSYVWGDPMSTKTLKLINTNVGEHDTQQCFVNVTANL
jgi:hypothetical protein